MAREMGVDYRMVVAALRGLEREGLLAIRPRGGIYAGRPAPPPRSSGLAGFGDRLVDLVLDELAIGLPIAAVTERLRHCLDTMGLRAACIECNDDQLDFLCQELQVGFGLHSATVEVGKLHGEPPLAVRQADLLVSTTFHASDVRRCAAKFDKPCVIVTLDPLRRADVARLLAERPVCFIGIDSRWAAKVREIWAREPGAERLQALTLGQNPLGSIPEEAALVVMPRARRLLAGNPLLERALPPRGFSHDTARQILSFLVQANLTGSRSPSSSRGR
jgi:hypothetical protein